MQHPPFFPAGYRFYPTDQELILHYLDNKVKGQPLPCPCSAKDFDIYGKHPWEIWDMFGGNDFSSERDKDLGLFFFTRLKKKTDGGTNYARSFCGGTWHAEAAGDPIKIKLDKDTEVTIGSKKRFSYNNDKHREGSQWMMYEFTTVSHSTDYVLCQLRMIKDKGRKRNSESGAAACNHNDALSKENDKKRKSRGAGSCKNPGSKKAKHVGASNYEMVGNSESQEANSEVTKSNVCKESGQEIAFEDQHGDEALSHLMIDLQDVEVGSIDTFLSISDEGRGQCYYGLMMDEIFPPTMIDKQIKSNIGVEEKHGIEASSGFMAGSEDLQAGFIDELLNIPDGEGDTCCYGLAMDEIFPPTTVDQRINIE